MERSISPAGLPGRYALGDSGQSTSDRPPDIVPGEVIERVVSVRKDLKFKLETRLLQCSAYQKTSGALSSTRTIKGLVFISHSPLPVS